MTAPDPSVRLRALAERLRAADPEAAEECERIAGEVEALRARARAAEGAVMGEQRRSFEAAFAHARAKGLHEFEWRGERYHTRTAEEDAALRDAQPEEGR